MTIISCLRAVSPISTKLRNLVDGRIMPARSWIKDFQGRGGGTAPTDGTKWAVAHTRLGWRIYHEEAGGFMTEVRDG